MFSRLNFRHIYLFFCFLCYTLAIWYGSYYYSVAKNKQHLTNQSIIINLFYLLTTFIKCVIHNLICSEALYIGYHK